MNVAEITVDAAIICDDVRREITGKAILIGVWPLELTIQNYPSDLFFAFHIEGSVIRSGNISPRLIVRDEVGGVLFDSDVSSKMESGKFVKGRFSIDFNVGVTFTRSGYIDFIVSMGAEEIIAAKRRVELGEIMVKNREAERAAMADDKLVK